jgi:hypothetical protein
MQVLCEIHVNSTYRAVCVCEARSMQRLAISGQAESAGNMPHIKRYAAAYACVTASMQHANMCGCDLKIVHVSSSLTVLVLYSQSVAPSASVSP